MFLINPASLRAGILHDVEATDKSIAAGGKNSEKGEFGVSDPYAIKKAMKSQNLMQKINQIESISLKVPVETTFCGSTFTRFAFSRRADNCMSFWPRFISQ